MKRLLEHSDVRRGDVAITLSSPSGTTSLILPNRPRDFVNSEGYQALPFMSVLHWGEQPRGFWLVNISYTPPANAQQQGHALVTSLNLILHGTSQKPPSIANIPPHCHASCAGKCGGAGPGKCDVCMSVRDLHSLHCKESCSHGEQVYENYCLSAHNTTHTSSPLTSPSSITTSAQPSSSIAAHNRVTSLHRLLHSPSSSSFPHHHHHHHHYCSHH